MGPFSEGALKDAVSKGRVHPEDLAVSQDSARSGTYTYLAVRKVLNMPDEKPAAASPNAPRVSRDPVVVPPQVQVLAVAAQENTPPPVNTTKPEFLNTSSSEDTAVSPLPVPVREPRRASSVTQETQTTERAPEWSSSATSSGGPSRLKWAGLGLSAVAAVALWLGTRGSSTDMVGGVKKLPAQSSPSGMVSRPRAAASESSPRKAPTRTKTSRSLRLPEAQPRQLDMSDVPGEGIHTPAVPETNNVPEPMPPPPGLEEPPTAVDAPPPPPPPASAADGAMETQGLPQPLEQ